MWEEFILHNLHYVVRFNEIIKQLIRIHLQIYTELVKKARKLSKKRRIPIVHKK